MSQEGDECCTTSMRDIQNRCIPDEIDLFYFKTCIITHNNNVIEQNIRYFVRKKTSYTCIKHDLMTRIISLTS